MNRPIKFRVWDKEYQEFSNWTNRDPFMSLSSGDMFFWERGQKEDIILRDMSERFVLQQFTGLLDKNGREIYDGDIAIYCPDTYSFYQSQRDCLIEYSQNEACFYISSQTGNFRWMIKKDFCSKVVEIIGNVYENPELVQ